jgi:Fe2+ transport system protein FeoA
MVWYIKLVITINEAPLNKNLVVRSFRPGEDRKFSEIESRLMLLGFLEGELVKIIKKAPVFKSPFLVEVRGRQIALSKDEAKMVKVEVSQ